MIVQSIHFTVLLRGALPPSPSVPSVVNSLPRSSCPSYFNFLFSLSSLTLSQCSSAMDRTATTSNVLIFEYSILSFLVSINFTLITLVCDSVVDNNFSKLN